MGACIDSDVHVDDCVSWYRWMNELFIISYWAGMHVHVCTNNAFELHVHVVIVVYEGFEFLTLDLSPFVWSALLWVLPLVSSSPG